MNRSRAQFYWLPKVLTGLLALASASAANAAAITVPIGVTADSSHSSYAFVGAADGNVWLADDYPHSGPFNWQNLGALASGVTVAHGVGTTAPGGVPAAYAIGSDANLYIIHQVSGSWSSQSIGAPSGVTLVKGLGVCSNTSNQPFVFVLGSDGNVWLAHNAGSWTWTNIGHPSGVSVSAAVGVTNVAASYPQLYVIGTDNDLWHASWNGSGYPWNNSQLGSGAPASVVAAVGAYTSGTVPVAYVIGSGAVLYAVSGGSSAGWSALVNTRPSDPPGLGVEPLSGYAYFTSGISLPTVWRPGHPGSFESSNCPSGLTPPCTQYGLGAANDNGFPVIFAVMTDGNLYALSSGGTTWDNIGTPP